MFDTMRLDGTFLRKWADFLRQRLLSDWQWSTVLTLIVITAVYAWEKAIRFMIKIDCTTGDFLKS